jgi:methionyl-tRNA formyltransferase
MRRPIGPEETSDEVERDLARLGAGLLVSSVDDLAAGRATETKQDDALATYAHRLKKEDGVIDWNQPAPAIHNLIRGLHPWPHAFTFLRGSRLIIRHSRASDTSDTSEAGTVVAAFGDDLIVATGGGALQIREIQAEGKRPMTARDFLAGHRLTPGDRFAATP